jgi:hypothetical protein
MAKGKPMEQDMTGQSGNPGQPGPFVSVEEREQMIAEAAYFRALQRGQNGGDPVQDWLAAEQEISRALPSPRQQKEELAAYEKLRARIRKIFTDVHDTVNADTIRQALDKAVTQLKEAGGHTADTIDKVAAMIEKDMAHAVAVMGPKWEAFSDKTADMFDIWRDRGSAFLTRAASGAADWLQQAGDRLKARTYHTGEMTHSGTFECTACGERLVLQTSAHLPVCNKCRKMEFRRV